MLAIFGSLVTSGIVFIGLHDRSAVSKRAMMEVNIIDGINKVELTKIALWQSLKNSFYQIINIPISQPHAVSSNGAIIKADTHLGETADFDLVLVQLLLEEVK